MWGTGVLAGGGGKAFGILDPFFRGGLVDERRHGLTIFSYAIEATIYRTRDS
jgi:hypothetical protein